MKEIKTIPYRSTAGMVPFDNSSIYCYIKNWKPSWKERYVLLVNKLDDLKEYIRLDSNTTYHFVRNQNDENIPCYRLIDSDKLYAIDDIELLENVIPEVL